MTEWLSSLFVFYAGTMSGLMDTLDFHWIRSVFWSLPDGSLKRWLERDWLNKYVRRNPKLGKIKLLGILPMPDAISDGWHTAKSIKIACILAAVYFGRPDWKLILICWLCWWIGFQLAYNGLIRKEEK
ncbi:hypothetical protein KKH13_04755 [Patescibacteria group bacterium]|uniref:Uncharacterized protein n=1 Tax=viral metagenome TaxID=1070528 RepID=A0A6M3ISM8_9ZZZZ|nr:hypothetical protein [Patescibacteria group bacterium]